MLRAEEYCFLECKNQKEEAGGDMGSGSAGFAQQKHGKWFTISKIH